jgi:hypothetical protein
MLLTLPYLFKYSSVMDLGVSEFAHEKRLSRGRVLQLIHAGAINARKVGAQWVIDSSELNHEPKISRPFSPKMSLAFLELLSKQELSSPLDPSERSRLLKRYQSLREHKDPALLLRSWLKKRALVSSFKASQKDLQKIREDARIYLSGSSQKNSKIGDGNIIEAYVEKQDLPELVKKYLLVESDKPNVIFRQIEGPMRPELLPALLISDLSDNYGPRERNLVKDLIREL